jgi:hypothetical protein
MSSPHVSQCRNRPGGAPWKRATRSVGSILLCVVALQLGCDPEFERRLYRYLGEQQNRDTGILESFTPNADLPPDFLEFLELHPGFIYDNSLAAIAFLDRGRPADLERARGILDAFVAIQAQEPIGGLNDAVNAKTLEPLAWDFGTGNQLWAVLAWLKGYRVLGDTRYLDAAEQAANFVLAQKNTVGYGGFVLLPNSTIVGTEHNVDAYAAFGQLAEELEARGRPAAAAEFRAAATHARIFVESRFDPVTGKTFTGTDDSGVTTSTFPVPEDTQTWTLLSLGGSKWRRGFEWLLSADGLWTASQGCPKRGPFEISGPSFSDADLSEVWVEGVAHVWVTSRLLFDRSDPGFPPWLAEVTLQLLQKMAPHADGRGLVAACGTLGTGFGFSFFNALAVAPTAWAIFGARDLDPFWDRSASGGLSDHPGSAVPWVALDTPPDQEFRCPTGDPCVFTVSGTSSGVADRSDLAVHVLIRPIEPYAGGTFTQFPEAMIGGDGTWSTTAQVGTGDFPAATGDTIEVSAMIVDTDEGTPPAIPPAVIVKDIPGLIAVTGILPATVMVAP